MFMKHAILAAAVLSLPLAHPSWAGDPAPSTTSQPNCDFFVNALIGTRCAGTFAVGAGLSNETQKVELVRSDYSTVVERNWLTPFEYVRVTPTSWLTLGFNSAYTDFDRSFAIKFANQTGSASHINNAFFGPQTFLANVNLVDTGPSASQYVVNLFAGDSIIPAHDRIDNVNLPFGGFTASGKWKLATSGRSLVGRAGLEASIDTNSDLTILFPTASLLLSDDVSSFAVGPVFQSAHIVSGGLSGHQADAYFAGAEVVAQPFKNSDSPFLAGLVLDVGAKQSIGRAGFVSKLTDASETIFSGSMRYNFKY
jgi:hypothetical protein